MHVCPRCGFKEALLVPEAAERLGVSDQTIRNWIKRGLLPGVETEPASGNGFRYWVPVEVLESDSVQKLAEASRSIGAMAKEGRQKAAAKA